MRTLFRLNGHVVTVMSWAAVAMIAVMMLAIAFEVGLRIARVGTVAGLIEGTEYALYFSTFLAIPGLLRSGEHIRIDIVVARLPPAQQRLNEVLAALAIIAVSLVLLWYGTKLTIDHIIDGRLIFKDVVFPQWWLDWVVPLAALTTGLVALERLMTPAPPPAATPAPGRDPGQPA